MRAAFAFFVATTLAAAPVFGQDDHTDGLYFGVGLGDFSTGVDVGDVDEASLDFDSNQNANKVFAGWRFNRLVAVQIDRVDFERSVDARDALSVLSTQAEGFAPSVVGTLPLGPLEVFARAGVFWYDLEIERNDTSLAENSDRDPIFGAGVGITIAERLNLRAEYEVVEIDGLDDPNAVWVTAAWRF
ncbi:MAG TPA: outer membrane beta-barrel protein [Gammaproteobacteria bacterium]|nr:outer membrane beta-barrel protein [Gammaproteobacteria bacterium]